MSGTSYDTFSALSKNISEDVLFDLRNNREFWKRYEGKIDDISNEINNTYLKANGVSEGVKSYGKMVDLLLVYYNLFLFFQHRFYMALQLLHQYCLVLSL